MTYRDFINSFLRFNPHDSVELKLRHYLRIEQDDYIWDKLLWLEFLIILKLAKKCNSCSNFTENITGKMVFINR